MFYYFCYKGTKNLSIKQIYSEKLTNSLESLTKNETIFTDSLAKQNKSLKQKKYLKEEMGYFPDFQPLYGLG